MVLAAAPVAARHGRLFLTSGATSPELPAEVPRYLFLACFGDNVQAAAGAEWAYRERRRPHRRGPLQRRDVLRPAPPRLFRTRFTELGGTIVRRRAATTPGAYGQALADLPDADIIYLAAGPGRRGRHDGS